MECHEGYGSPYSVDEIFDFHIKKLFEEIRVKKMKRKKVSAICAVLLGTLLFCACGGEEEERNSSVHVREESRKEQAGADIKEEAAEEKKEEDKEKEKEAEKEEKAKGGEDELRAVLLKNSGASETELQVFEYGDFDRDGNCEAFALIGDQMEDYGDGPLVEGALWFVSDGSCDRLRETGGMGFRNEARIMEIGGTDYVMFDEVYVTEAVTNVWYVDGGAVEASFSCCGNVVLPEEKDRFCIMKSSYDATLDPDIGTPVGHTWKYYYFFYNNEEGRVNEYAGTTIDAATVEYLCGRDLLAELMSDHDRIDNIFCRGNGHIVINYEYEEGGLTNYEHYIYDYLNGYYLDDYGQKLPGPEAQAGICASSICPGIASYPGVPGQGDTVWYGE